MKIILAGGSGLIGRALTESLAQDDHEVIILSRAPNRVKELPNGARAIAWDARTVNSWKNEIDGADAIINLTGANLKGDRFLPSRWTPQRKKVLRDSRIHAAAALIEAVKSATKKPALFIQSSAIGYYGPRTNEAITENGISGNDFLARLCVDWEASSLAIEDLGLRRVVLRTGLALSMQGGSFPLLLLPFKLFLGNTFGSGRQIHSWIHMADLVSAFRFILENDRASGIYNLTAPNPVSNREFAQTLGRIMRRPSFFPLPALMMKLALGELSTVLLDGQRVLPAHLQSQEFEFAFPEIDLALRDLLKK